VELGVSDTVAVVDGLFDGDAPSDSDAVGEEEAGRL